MSPKGAGLEMVERWSLAIVPGLLDSWPLNRPQNWLELVNDAVSDTELQSLRRGRPHD